MAVVDVVIETDELPVGYTSIFIHVGPTEEVFEMGMAMDTRTFKKNSLAHSPGVLPNVIQLAHHMGNIGANHLEGNLLLPHDLKPAQENESDEGSEL